jgi:hypothetical protein
MSWRLTNQYWRNARIHDFFVRMVIGFQNISEESSVQTVIYKDENRNRDLIPDNYDKCRTGDLA